MDSSSHQGRRIAVLVPCYNEAPTIAGVVAEFRKALPGAEIHVFDNASTDGTGEMAHKAGAAVTNSPLPGKGNVVRHMFDVVEADWYIMVDGDSTYPPEAAGALLAAAEEMRLGMMVGRRVTPAVELRDAYRPLHQFGNRLICALIRKAFGCPIHDVFSGFRVFSREFVKTIPLRSTGFQIEVEMTLQAISKVFPVGEMDVSYKARPKGSVSKLNTYRDGMLVLAAFAAICKDYRPALFFGSLAGVFGVLSLAAGSAPLLDYMRYQWVYHVPLAILATGLALLSALSLCIGVILETQLRYHNEMHRLVRQGLFR
ncbi:MAG: glycosyltransferase [Verrucomicrobiaceae bacterium]|nr:MAG: glycosyltransferase [Verrucomicrobiaceae bacterium]